MKHINDTFTLESQRIKQEAEEYSSDNAKALFIFRYHNHYYYHSSFYFGFTCFLSGSSKMARSTARQIQTKKYH